MEVDFHIPGQISILRTQHYFTRPSINLFLLFNVFCAVMLRD